MIKAVRGTRDLLPPETAVWNFVEEKVREVFRAYNFQEIRTPIFEATELFARGVGEETDIVSKEMYTWEDGGSKTLPRGAIDWFDAMNFRNVGSAQAFLDSVGKGIAEGKITLVFDQKELFNRAANDFNEALDLSKKYHDKEITDTKLVAASTTRLVNSISALIQGIIPHMALVKS